MKPNDSILKRIVYRLHEDLWGKEWRQEAILPRSIYIPSHPKELFFTTCRVDSKKRRWYVIDELSGLAVCGAQPTVRLAISHAATSLAKRSTKQLQKARDSQSISLDKLPIKEGS